MILRGFQQERDGFRRDRSNFVAESGCELGIEREHFEGESHLIRDAGSRAVAACSEFQIFRPIVVTNAVDVVNGFFWSKFSPEYLLHDVAVVKNLLSTLVRCRSDGDSKVASSCRPRRRFFIGEVSEHLRAFERSSAFLAAHDAVSAVSFSTLFHDFSAVLARFVFKRSASDSTAGRGAIEGASSVFLNVASEFSRVSVKCFSALPAVEFHLFDELSGAVYHFSSPVAFRTAKFPSALSLLIRGRKMCSALNALQVCRHSYLQVIGRFVGYHSSGASATEFSAGVV